MRIDNDDIQKYPFISKKTVLRSQQQQQNMYTQIQFETCQKHRKKIEIQSNADKWNRYFRRCVASHL